MTMGLILFYTFMIKIKFNTMKYILFSLLTVTLMSCGGWSKGQENAFLDSCKKSPSFDCDCSLKIVKEKYPNASDFNEKGGKDLELAKKIGEKCSK
jgi:hypothetical protein